jgi:hypothetical protein
MLLSKKNYYGTQPDDPGIVLLVNNNWAGKFKLNLIDIFFVNTFILSSLIGSLEI